MKKNLLLLLIYLFLAAACGNKNELPVDEVDYYVKVVRISDGDTFIGRKNDNNEIRFRLQGIDAPEMAQAYGSQSKDKLSKLISEKQVGIRVHTPSDTYGRPVVYVIMPDGNDVGAEMLRAGMAWHYKHYDNSPLYERLELEARAKKIGLWADEKPIPPWEFRRN